MRDSFELTDVCVNGSCNFLTIESALSRRTNRPPFKKHKSRGGVQKGGGGGAVYLCLAQRLLKNVQSWKMSKATANVVLFLPPLDGNRFKLARKGRCEESWPVSVRRRERFTLPGNFKLTFHAPPPPTVLTSQPLATSITQIRFLLPLQQTAS